MRKYFHLANCDTCQRILSDLGELLAEFYGHEIKTTPISENDITEMRKRTDSYESLFSRRAMKFRSMGLGEKDLSEEDYKSLIKEEYTFLKRPVFIVEDKIFIGNSKKNIEKLKKVLAS